jgi:hypothetical protein
MNMVKSSIAKGIRVILNLVLLASLLGMGGCHNGGAASNDSAPDTPSKSGTPTEPMILELSFPNNAPRLNQTAELRCVLKVGRVRAENVNIEMNLPDGIELVSGGSWVLGNVSENELTHEVKAVIRPVKVGNYSIKFVLSLVPLGTGFKPGPGIYNIYLSVSENSAQWATAFPPWQKDEGLPKPKQVPPQK